MIGCFEKQREAGPHLQPLYSLLPGLLEYRLLLLLMTLPERIGYVRQGRAKFEPLNTFPPGILLIRSLPYPFQVRGL